MPTSCKCRVANFTLSSSFSYFISYAKLRTPINYHVIYHRAKYSKKILLLGFPLHVKVMLVIQLLHYSTQREMIDREGFFKIITSLSILCFVCELGCLYRYILFFSLFACLHISVFTVRGKNIIREVEVLLMMRYNFEIHNNTFSK